MATINVEKASNISIDLSDKLVKNSMTPSTMFVTISINQSKRFLNHSTIASTISCTIEFPTKVIYKLWKNSIIDSTNVEKKLMTVSHKFFTNSTVDSDACFQNSIAPLKSPINKAIKALNTFTITSTTFITALIKGPIAETTALNTDATIPNAGTITAIATKPSFSSIGKTLSHKPFKLSIIGPTESNRF